MENPNLKALIIGSVLGDGHIQKTQSKTQKCRLRVAQGPDQKTYLEAKYYLLSSICPSAPKYDHRNNTYHFYTSYCSEIKEYHDLLYAQTETGFRKTIQVSLKGFLEDPLALAIWYCDDGSKRQDSDACRIATHSYNLEEIQCLRWILWENFQIPSHVVKGGRSLKGKHQWYVLSLSARDGGFTRLRELILPIVELEFPSMLYKLGSIKSRPRND